MVVIPAFQREGDQEFGVTHGQSLLQILSENNKDNVSFNIYELIIFVVKFWFHALLKKCGSGLPRSG